MFLPQIEDNVNTNNLITQWRGYNHNYAIGLGEFYDMENMTCDGFPITMARDIRPTLLNALHAYRGILYTDSALCWLDGNTFHYKTWMIDLSPLVNGTELEVAYDAAFVDEPDSEVIEWNDQNLIRFGAYVLIYPMGVWVDIADRPQDRKAGNIASHFESAIGKTITYTISKKDGSDYEHVVAQDTAPVNPNEGDYWLNTAEGSEGLNVYLQSSWQPVPTCYIRIELTDAGFDEYFRVEDIVTMNIDDSALKDLNDGSMIQAIDEDFIVMIGLMDAVTKTETTSSGYRLKIERVMPDLDFICADKNRLWGCKYGHDTGGNLINEIYASKLGDFKNWYSFQGLSTDSYTATIGNPGAFTGCISYGGYPTFFKEDCIIRISGNYPAEYNVMTMNARGVQNGSARSLAIVGEALYYKAPGGVMVYDGSLPRMISDAFGKDSYYDGVAGVCGDKYFIEMQNEKGGHRVFVYDSRLGLWTKESHLGLLGFSGSLDGRLFAYTYGSVYGFGLSDNELYTDKKVSEEYVDWFLETGDIGIDIPEFKYVSKLTLRAYIPSTSEIMIEVSYDDKPYEHMGDIRGLQETMTHVISVFPYRCDHFRLRLHGHGKVRIYSLAISYDSESDEYEYKN